MYKYLKTIAPVILILFLPTCVIGPCWGTDWIIAKDNPDIRYWLTSNNDLPVVDSKYEVKIDAEYKHESLEQLKLQEPSPFKLVDLKSAPNNILGINTGGWVHVFILQAPSTPGTYDCSFEGTTQTGEKVYFSYTLRIQSMEEQTYLSIGRISGFIIGAGIIAAAGPGANPLASGFIALLAGFSCGYIGGLLGGMYYSNFISNNN